MPRDTMPERYYTSGGQVSVCQCLSVCHMLVLYRSVYTDGNDCWQECFFRPILHGDMKKFGCLQNMLGPS